MSYPQGLRDTGSLDIVPVLLPRPCSCPCVKGGRNAMIDDLDKSLENLLKRELPPELVAQITISFATPDGQFPPPSVTLPAIDLFLYDVRENRELRDGEWRIERQSDGTAVRKAPPVRVDCSYLITAWAGDPLSEHLLLGQVMQALLRRAPIPPTFLEGALAQHGEPLRYFGSQMLFPLVARQVLEAIQDIVPFEVSLGGYVILGRKPGRFLGAEHLPDLGRRPDVELALLAFGVGIERGAERALLRRHLALEPLDGLARASAE